MKTDLTNEQKRVLIAQACGWESLAAEGWPSLGYQHGKRDGHPKIIPDYFASLDSCAEFINTLQGNAHPSAVTDELRAYRDALAKVMGIAWYQSADILKATPAQHVEAFARVRGLW